MKLSLPQAVLYHPVLSPSRSRQNVPARPDALDAAICYTAICYISGYSPDLEAGAEIKSMAELNERITVDPSVLVGKPVIRGTRISVEFIIGLMAERWNEADILNAYPDLKAEDIQACLAYARDVMSSERVFPAA